MGSTAHFEVRAALDDDAPVLDALAKSEGLAFCLERELGRIDVLVLVALELEQRVGFVAASFAGDEVEILDVAVRPAQRRRGCARRLIDALLTMASQRRAVRVVLEVRRSNAAALGLYRGLGFEVVGQRTRYYRDGEDALVLARLVELGT